MSKKMTQFPALASIQDAAKLLNVSTKTLRRWEARGVLVPVRSSGGHRRYDLNQVRELKGNRKHIRISTVASASAPAPRLEAKDISVLYERLHVDQKKVLRFVAVAVTIFVVIFATVKFTPQVAIDTVKSRILGLKVSEDVSSSFQNDREKTGAVLAAATGSEKPSFNINIESAFRDNALFNQDVQIDGNLILNDQIIGDVDLTGVVIVGGNSISTGQSTFNLINTTATTINMGGAATTLNIGPTGSGTSSILLSGGAANTGCTLDGSTGTLSCSGGLTGSTLNVTGNSTVGGTQTVTGKMTGSGDLAISGNATFGNITSINGVTYSFPTSQGGSSTFLTNNGSGTLTWTSTSTSGVTSIANGGTNNSAAYTAGSVIFSDGTKLTQDNANFFWDDTNNRLGIGNAAPGVALDVTGAGTFSSTLTANNGLTLTTGALNLTSTSGTFDLTSTATTGNAYSFTTNALTADNSNAHLLTFQNANTGAGTLVNGLKIIASGSTPSSGTNTENLISLTGNTLGSNTFNGIYFNTGLSNYVNSTNWTVTAAGAQTMASDLGVNGGNITTTQTVASLFNTNATTLNIGGAATTLNLGETSGTTTIAGNTVLGNAITDSITFTARVAQDSDLLPIGTTGTNDLGSALLPWDNVFATVFNQNGNLVCDASGANCPAAGSGGSKWRLSEGAISPFSDSLDVLIGSLATASAKFAFKNVASGVPTASISGTTAFVSTFLTGEGNLATTNNANLTIGGASTGNIILNPNNAAAGGFIAPNTNNVTDLGTALLTWRNIYAGTVAATTITQGGNGVCDSSGANCPSGAAGGSKWKLSNGAISPFTDNLDVLIGNSATTSAKFAFMNVATGLPTASISGTIANVATYLDGNGNLSTTNAANLTLGSSSTGNVVINSRGNTAVTVDGLTSTFGGLVTASNGFTLTTGALNLTSTSGTSNLTSTATSGDSFAFTNTSLDTASANLANFTVKNNNTGAGLSVNGVKVSATGSTPSSGTNTTNLLDLSATVLANNTFNGINFGSGLTNYINGTNFTVTAAGNIAALGGMSVSGGTINLNATGTSSTNIGNATGTTTIAGNVLPATTDSVSLGSSGSLQFNNIYANAFLQDGNLVCDASGTNCPTGTAGGSKWKYLLGAISPFTDDLDVLIGSSATTSAKFAFKNVAAGVPTASISGTTAFVSTFIDGEGNISTTNRANLVLGNSATYNSTGNVLINPNGTGYVGIGTTAPNSPFHLARADGVNPVTLKVNNTIGAGGDTQVLLSTSAVLSSDAIGASIYADRTDAVSSGDTDLLFRNTVSSALATNLIIKSSGVIGMGTTAPDAKLEINHATGDNLRLTYNDSDGSATAYTDFSLGSDGDLTIDSAGGNINLLDDLAANANVTLGDAITDTITFTGRVAQDSDLIPIGTTGTNDLGTALLPWDNVYAGANGFNQNGNLVCDASGANCPSATAGGSKWKLLDGAISPFSDSLDVLIGNSATTSAKFAFTNILTGVPTFDVSFGPTNLAIKDNQTNAFRILEGGTNVYLGIQTWNGAPTLILDTPDAGGTMNIGSSANTHTINVAGTGATSADTINIGTGGTGIDTLNLLTGNGGNTLNLGTDNTVKDTLNIGSALDDVIINGAGTGSLVNFANFDVATTGNITVAAGEGLDTNAAGVLELGDTTATTVSIGSTAATTLNLGAGGALTRAINIGTGTGADTISIGTGGTGADTITIGNSASTTALNFTSGTGAQTFASSVATGTTTSSAFVFTGNALTTGTGMYLNSSSITTGTLLAINASSTTLTTGKLFDVQNNSSSVFNIGASQITSVLPHQFTAAGDVTMAYDLVFTNQTASTIDSYGPLTVRSGESFESNNLTLKTYNSGNIIFDTATAGKVLVGTGSATLKFTVSDSQAATASAMIENMYNGSDADALAIKLGYTGNGATTNRFITFLNGVGNMVGRVEATTGLGVAYQTSGIDFAEYFTKEVSTSFDEGDIVSLKGSAAVKADTENDSAMIGIVSSSPGFKGGNEGPDKVLVGLVGQVPLKISGSSDPIKVGDLITSSSESGRGKKANGPGFIIGKALESWSGQDKIMVYVNPSWADPSMSLNSDGNLKLAGDSNNPGYFRLTDSNGNTVDKLSGLTALITNTFNAFQGTVDNLLVKAGLISPEVLTRDIKPLAGEKDINITLGTATQSGNLAIKNAEGETVTTIDSTGDATFNGQINSENASISGALFASTIYADQIISKDGKFGDVSTNTLGGITREQIEELLNSVEEDQNLVNQSQNWSTDTATSSAALNELSLKDLYVTGVAAFESLHVTNNVIFAGELAISKLAGSEGSLITLDTLDSPLSIQSAAAQPLYIMAGKVKVDTTGNVQILGDLAVGGVLSASAISLAEDPNASVSASLTGNVLNSLATAGEGSVASGSADITIVNPNIKTESLIFVTPTSESSEALYVKSKEAGTATVGFKDPTTAEVTFNWWIVNLINGSQNP
jgi:hypothetical protein